MKTPADLKDLKPGNIVIVSNGREVRRAIVERVGRKYLHAGRKRFLLSTGVADDSYRSARLYTLDQWEARERLHKAKDELTTFGFQPHYSVPEWLVLKVHELLQPLIEESKKGTSR